MGARFLGWVFVLAAAVVPARVADAQYFGHNKVQYDDRDFRSLRTEHFAIYFADGDSAAAQLAGRLAERWYTRLSQILDHELSGRQIVVLYSSHPDFEQTNVISGFLGEEIGGVTESRRRRIVMPFGVSLAETDRILGHEIVHAFQYDIADAENRSLALVPLWFVEGMAEYLSRGPADAATAMIVRDAARHGRMPSLADGFAEYGVSPYRAGHALWAWLGGRFGDEVVAKILKAAPRNALRRIEAVTGLSVEDLTRAWHADIERSLPPRDAAREMPAPLITDERGGGRVNIAPALSPDGSRILYLSERDRLSIDVYVAETATGRVERKLLSTAANPFVDSLQFLNTGGTWSRDGRRIVLAVVRNGGPVFVLFDAASGDLEGEHALASLDQVFHPSLSPDGRQVVFTGLKHGLSDVYLYDFETGDLRMLTDDAFTDFQPEWSPDGRTLVFVTDRFTTDLADLHFGEFTLAVLDAGSLRITKVDGTAGLSVVDPQWAPDGERVYARALVDGVHNVLRIDLASGAAEVLTDVETGVVGVTGLSPALSVASASGRLAIGLYRNNRYEIRTFDQPVSARARLSTVTPTPEAERPPAHMLPGARMDTVAALLADDAAGLPPAAPMQEQAYSSNLTLDAIGQPYFMMSAGGAGGSVRGGTSFLFSDLLGDHRLAAAVQAGLNLEDLAFETQYLNQSSRWTWGNITQLVPYVRGLERREITGDDADQLVTRESERHRQMHLSVAGFAAYPFNRSTRIELSAGTHSVWYHRQIRSRIFRMADRELISDELQETAAPAPLTLLETSVALVRDTAIRGPVSPILGNRMRLELTRAFGEAPFTQALADYRRYWIPARPYTVAVRALHIGRYGPGGDDERLVPLYIGRPGLVRGHSYGAVRDQCGTTPDGRCAPVDALLGSKLLVTQAELRAPLKGIFSGQLEWGPLPLEALMFADAGTAWSGSERPTWAGGNRPVVGSVGLGVRLRAASFVLEFDAARRIGSHTPRGWTFVFSASPGF
jgi:hypothetical protein